LHNVFVKFNNPITWQGNKDKKMRDIYHELVLTYKTWWIFFNSFGRHVGFGLWSTVIIKQHSSEGQLEYCASTIDIKCLFIRTSGLQRGSKVYISYLRLEKREAYRKEVSISAR